MGIHAIFGETRPTMCREKIVQNIFSISRTFAKGNI
jgi:hypothetical protein